MTRINDVTIDGRDWAQAQIRRIIDEYTDACQTCHRRRRG